MSHGSSRFSGYKLGADIRAGFMVFLIALPLSLGIAMASGFPPIAGLITAIIGGTIATFAGSARLTIKGPAAGLIVIVIGAVTELGAGDMAVGYQCTLAIGVVAGALQITFAVMRLGFIGALMPPAVVHGMLAAIGVIIVSKQSHVMLGVVPEAKAPFALLAEIPQSVAHANPEIVLIGVLSLVILFALPRIRALSKIPAPMIVLATAIPLGLAFDLATAHEYTAFGHSYRLAPEMLVRLPASLAAAITGPDFSVITSGTSLKYIVLLTAVGGIESLLSATAVDSLDPVKRASDMDKDLLATGIGTLIASSIGGLPMISEIVRSKANIDNGATSPFANFAHGAFLLMFVVLLPGVLQMIPLAALAAMLVFTGTRLASPNEFAHALHVGREQLLVFVVTAVTTLATDILVGVATGLVLELAIWVVRGTSIGSLFRLRIDPRRDAERATLHVSGCAVFVNLRKLTRALEGLDEGVREVVVDFTGCSAVDHTTQTRLRTIAAEWHDRKLEIAGLGGLAASSNHAMSARWKRR